MMPGVLFHQVTVMIKHQCMTKLLKIHIHKHKFISKVTPLTSIKNVFFLAKSSCLLLLLNTIIEVIGEIQHHYAALFGV